MRYLALAALLFAVPLSAQTIRVTTPPGVAGLSDVVVTNPDGQADTIVGGYEYIAPVPLITSVSPGSGPVVGGTEIVVVGEDFDPGAVVTVGGVVASAVGSPAPEPSPDGWPDNEPAGLVPVFPGHPTVPGVLVDGSELYFDYTGQGGSDLGSTFFFGGKWDGTKILKTTSSGSRYANVIRKNMYIGDGDGWNGLASLTNFAAEYEELYARMIFKYSANWQFHGSAEKLFLLGEASGGPQDFVVGLTGGQKLFFVNQSGAAGDGGEWRSSVDVTKDEWHTVELYMVAQSALGTADGSFQLWYDGVEITSWSWLGNNPDPGQTAIEWFNTGSGTRLFSGMEFPLYWGGQGSTKTVDDHIDLSELYITGKIPA